MYVFLDFKGCKVQSTILIGRHFYETIVSRIIYLQKSNPLSEEESPTQNIAEPKKHSTFQERIRAERESFKAVFDGRRPRI